ncbi:unnamed protein product, partial [Brassica oleracea var. botrytis]
ANIESFYWSCKYCLFGKPVEVEDSDVRDKSIVENK